MADIQQLGDLHMALHVNKLLFEQGKITDEMYRYANHVFTERLERLEKNPANALCETA